MSYKNYLSSSHWKKTRKRTFKKKGKYCRFCLSKNKLHVHHIKYNFFEEKNGQLAVLCARCHGLWHRYHKHKKIRASYYQKIDNVRQLGGTMDEAIRFCVHSPVYKILIKHLEEKIELNRFKFVT